MAISYVRQWDEPSSDGTRSYRVSVTYDGQWQCSCRGWTMHTPRRDCKHILRVKARRY